MRPRSRRVPEFREPDPIPTIGVIGAGSWGTLLAVLLARQGNETRLIARNAMNVRIACEQMAKTNVISRGLMFPERMSVHPNSCGVLSGVDCLIVAVPSVAMREVMS